MYRDRRYSTVGVVNGVTKPIVFTVTGSWFASDSAAYDRGYTELELVTTTNDMWVLRRTTKNQRADVEKETHHVFDTREDVIKTLDPIKALDRSLLEKLGEIDNVCEEV